MEEEAKSNGRQLRQSTLSHQPGRYEESQAYGVQISSWVHPPLVFDHTLPRHCSFPSVPLDQPGRADAYVAARERGELDEKNKDCSYNKSDEEVCRAPTADNDKDDCNTVAHNIAERGPKQGETLTEFLSAVTNDLDWGSPEPDEIGEPIEWCQITLSGQWILLLALCQYKAFAPATQLLRMNTTDIITFVGLYIHCHRETKKWAKEIDGTPVEGLLQMARGVWPGDDRTNDLKRPYLPTDVLWDSERKQAVTYLHQVGQRRFVDDVKVWRGCSTSFYTLPIEPEIMAACAVILDKGMGSLDFKNIELPQTKKSSTWPGGVHSECQDLAKCLAELQAYLPRPCPQTTDPSVWRPAGNLQGSQDPWKHHNTKRNNIGLSNKKIQELWSKAQHDIQFGQVTGPAGGLNHDQDLAQDKLSVAGSSQDSGTTIDYRKMDELYDPELLPKLRAPSVDLSGYPDFATPNSHENTPMQQGNSMQDFQPEFEALAGLKVPSIQIREASPQAESDCIMSCETSAGQLLPPVRFLHPPARLPGPNLGMDTHSFSQGQPVDVRSRNHMPTYTGTNGLAPPSYTLMPNEVKGGYVSQWDSFFASLATFPDSSTPDPPSSGNTLHDGGTVGSHNPTDVQMYGIPVTYQGCNRPDSQLNPSLALVVAGITGSQEPHLQASIYAAPNGLSQTTTDQAVALPPIASRSKTDKISASGGTQQKEFAPAYPACVDDYLEPPATLSSRKSTRRQRSESDEEYQPRTKRARKPDAKKSTSQKKSISSLQPSPPQPVPNPKPVTKLQTGTAGTIEPVKRGRGRPRKYPRPQDLAAQPTQNQLSTPQVSPNNADTQVSAADFSDASNTGHPASARVSSTDRASGCQDFGEGSTAAHIPTVASASAPTLAHSSPQYYFHTFQLHDEPHATIPELDTLQGRANLSRDEITRPHPNSYEEFWVNHQNLTEAARQERRLSHAMPDISAPSSTPSGSETTLNAEVAFSPAASQIRPDIRQTPPGATRCAPSGQKQLRD